MSTSNTSRFDTAAVVGAGTIGLAWAALFAAHGTHVRLSDPRSDLRESLENSLPELCRGIPGADVSQVRERIELGSEPEWAVAHADLVQENAPERLEFKQDLFLRIARAAPEDAVLASSSSGLLPSDISAKLPDRSASRLLVAHPFNPPHIVPLVEIVPGRRTDEAVSEAAFGYYERLGKTPVRLHRETSGFVANRLQSALLAEAFDLVLRGVVDAAELDTIVKNSLGNRWATVGPFESFHLGGGPAGIRHMMEHLGKGMAERWKDLGTPELTDTNIDVLAGQTERAYGNDAESYRERSARRDRNQRAVLAALRDSDR
ncbi:3-hydroxyacyl-CoA dehydrogenase NAD-binding domain-containing protein [Actinopolyspora mortivallis]|uniref:3-hydroxyacyl-CoA dehydrogenase NAD-binding domain-containing protein n=1 Tax=Actinopolyspora mortivallis TaxID=33906 RepID=UPI000683FE1C|nr:3-hydroxyacyl-CoA dehydrogenase NAD-binding domain-containing protein [Actinopolyspora mortivallis]